MVEIVEKEVYNEEKLCRRCHRKLVDENSIKLGFGPTCYKKYLSRKKSYLFDLEVTNEIIKER